MVFCKKKYFETLFVDEEGRLWIGTNDSGLAIRVGDRITNVLSINDRLSSNSVRSITQDDRGNYYTEKKVAPTTTLASSRIKWSNFEKDCIGALLKNKKN